MNSCAKEQICPEFFVVTASGNHIVNFTLFY